MPPCGIVSNAALKAEHCDTIIFAVKANSTSVQTIKKALQYILYSNARLIGFVVNNKDFTMNDYGKKVYYSHYKRYGYQYSYNYGYGIDKPKTEDWFNKKYRAYSEFFRICSEIVDK